MYRVLVVVLSALLLASLSRADQSAPRSFTVGDGPAHLAFSPDGETLAVGAGQKLRLYDTATWKESLNLPGHTWSVRGVAFAPDGKLLVSGAGGFREGKRGGEVKLWDVATGKVKHELAWWAEADVNAAAFSPDGARVAGGGLKGVRIWDAATGKLVKELPCDAAVLALACAPDGKTLAAGAFTQNIHLWNTVTWKESVLKGHTSEVRAVAYSPDSKLLVTGGVGEARVWNTATGECSRALKHQSTVWSVTFAPNGKTVATGSGDPVADSAGEVCVWASAEGAAKGQLAGKRGAVVSVAFSPDGKTMACGQYDGGVVVCDPARLVK